MRFRVWAVLATALPFWLIATPALADPVSGAIVAGLKVIGIAVSVQAVNGFLINVAFQVGLGFLQKSRQKTPTRQADVLTLSLGETPRAFVFGECAVGGSLCEAFNWGGQHGTDWEVQVIALADHPVEDLVAIHAWDRVYPFSANGLQSGFGNQVDIEFVNATPEGTAKPARFPTGDWDPTFAGVTHIWIAYKAELVAEMGSRPQFRFQVKGAKLYDARKDSTVPGGSGAHRWSDPPTWEWSDNLALVRDNWMRGIYAGGQTGEPQHLWIGRGLSAIEAPLERVFAAANLCAEAVPLKGGGSEPRYRASGVILADEPFDQVERRFEAACAGVLVQRDGGLDLEPGAAKSAVIEITDSDLVEGERTVFDAFLPKPDRRNSVILRFISADQKFAALAAPIRRSLDDITADGGPFEDEETLDFVTSPTQCQRVGEIRRRMHRMERRATIVLGPRFSMLEEGDWIGWTSDRYHNGARVVYRVERFGRAATWRRTLALREINASAFTWDEDVDELTPGEDAALDSTSPTALTLTGVGFAAIDKGGRPTVRAVWDTPADPAIEAVRLDVRLNGSAEITPTTTTGVMLGEMDADAGVPSLGAIEVRLVPIGQPHRQGVPGDWIDLDTSALQADGLKTGSTITFSNGRTSTLSGRTFQVVCEDGVPVELEPAFPAPPVVFFQGEFDAPDPAEGEYIRTRALMLEGSGFLPDLKIVSEGVDAEYTARVDDGAGGEVVVSGQIIERQKALAGVAHNGRYIFTIAGVFGPSMVGPPGSESAVPKDVSVAAQGRLSSGDPWETGGVFSGSTGLYGFSGISIVAEFPWAVWDPTGVTEYRVIITTGYHASWRYLTSLVSVAYDEQTAGSPPGERPALSEGRQALAILVPPDLEG